MQSNNIQLGLCCINTSLRDKNIFCSRKPILRTIEERGVEYLKKVCMQNCKDLLAMIEWNEEHNIKVLRLSSGLFPHYSNPRLKTKFSLHEFQDILTKIGGLAKKYGHRLTFHPGQYNVLATPNRDVLKKTILELYMHADILDRLGCDQDSVMVIHGGGIYNNKEETKKRWAERYILLPDKIKNRLVLENCEKCFSIQDCLDISKICGVPIVFDTLHFSCYKQLHITETFKDEQYYIPLILETWSKKNIKPKFHISEQCKDGKIGKHSDYIEIIPDYLLNISTPIDIMIEAKKKEQAIFRLYDKYNLNPKKQSLKNG